MYFHRLIVAAGLCALIAGAYAATTVGSLEPTTGTWRAYRGTNFATLACSNSSEAAMLACVAADAERRAATTRYQLRYPNRYVTATYTAPTPTCPTPPPVQTRPGTCPAGTEGSWTQTGTTTFGPPPACTPTVTWSTAPAGACVPVTPPPAGDWTLCAVEYQTCTFTGTRRARFGLNTSWVERDLAGPIACRINTFGSDPVPGVAKRCELRNVDTPPPPAATGTATLSWTPPTANTDGSSLSNLAGYRISYGLSPTELVHTVQVSNPSVRQYTIEDLGPRTYYFSVRAYRADGAESVQSNVSSKVVQ